MWATSSPNLPTKRETSSKPCCSRDERTESPSKRLAPGSSATSSRPMKARRTDDGSCAWSAVATRTMALTTDKRWIVSVAMISEGVDIKRLRVLIYLPNALTELAFRQAIGRVVRTIGPTDDTRAYVVMPSFEIFEAYARRVEAEMPTNESSNIEKPP